MYFKKLEIFGFKSFADKTVLNFEPGITAIVGPNGCGKSNFFDSIRWVLGEQSIKELRGSSKEDVIFNGTQNKPALGFAEVSLTFSNESRMLPVEYDEVTVSRRLFRSGESEYLLNKTVVRLKDIQEMLMGTGIGAEAYSMVQQGKVDLIVSAKPEERRIILDEASGITRYKSKKREALNRLRDTENNLLRVNDITVEVKRQIASSERQANKARKYKEEYVKLKDFEFELAGRQIQVFVEDKERITTQLAELQQRESSLSQELEQLTERLTNEINYLGELEQKINEIRSEEIKLDGQIDLDNRQIGFNQERIENFTQNDQKLRDQKKQLIERCRVQQEKIQTLEQDIAVLEETAQYNEQVLDEKRQSLKELESLIKESKEKIRDHEENILALTSQQVNLRNELTDIMKEAQQAMARKRRLDMENTKVSSESQEVDQKLQNVKYQIGTIQGTINELYLSKEEKDQVLGREKQELLQLEKNIDDLEKQKLFLKSQKEFIEKLHTQYQDIPDPVVLGRLLTETPPLDHHTGIIGKVKEVHSHEGEGEFEIVCETKFIELDPQQISSKINEIDGEINALILQKDELVQKIQTQEEVLEEVKLDIQNKEKFYSILESQKKDILEEVRKLSGELELVDLELSEVNEVISTTHKKEEELNYKLDTVTKDIVWAQNDIKAKQDWIATKLQEKEENTVLIAQIETEIKADKDKVESQRDNQVMFSQDLDRWLGEIKEIDDEVAAQVLKKEQYAQETEVLREKIEKLKQDKQSLQGALDEQNAQKIEVAQKVNSLRAEMTSLEEQIEKTKQKLHDFELKSQKIEFGEKGVKDRLVQTYQIDFDTVIAERKEVELQEAPALDLLDQSPDQNVGVEVQVVENQEAEDRKVEGQEAEKQEIKKKIEKNVCVDWDTESLQTEIARLQKRCNSFGSVNLMAIEEFDELRDRFEFLTKQQADLLEAKSQLMSTINKINRSTRQMFMDTFTKVSEEFRIYFRMLFGGGEAELVLLDPENVLESGVEIVARPPGKKLQSISLLSGGEKTLTAIALIFGVFKVNPSPFCILDEIDAALDEANVGRYSYLLKDFAKIAQFIVITHNKKTMAHCDVMYGITMPETGVSRVVSVKFPKKNQEAQEEVPVGV